MEKYETLDIMDLNRCVRRLPRKLGKLMKKHGPKIVVAGGYIRSVITGEYVSDIDLFAGNKTQSEIFATELQGDNKFHKTDNAFTVTNMKPKPQFIFRWVYDQPEDVLKSFDYTICQAAFWWNLEAEKWQSVCGSSFYRDIAAKRLIYLSPVRNEDAGGSMLRVLKFYQRGYRIPLDSLGAVISRLIKGIDWNKVEESRHIEGSDFNEENRIAEIVSGLLYEVDPNAIIDHRHYLPARTGDSAEGKENEPPILE